MSDDETTYEWGVRHSQGMRPEPSEKAALESFQWLLADYENSRRKTFRPYIVRRSVTPWVPIDSANPEES